MAGDGEYDMDNIFAKILDGKVPCFKVFESKASLAFLDAFPMVEGHTLLIPKVKGYKALTDMPPAKAADFLRDLSKVAAAVKEATGASGVNIWQNNGEDAGQVVFHPHFHIVPRFKDDAFHTYPPSAKSMISPEAAKPVVDKISAALNPPTPLRKAQFIKVSSVDPDSRGLNIRVQILEEPKETEPVKGSTFFEVLCGDDSGSVVLSLKEGQKELCPVGKTVDIRNASVKMVKNHIMVVVDKWGKIDTSDEEVVGDRTQAKNVSVMEYELVTH